MTMSFLGDINKRTIVANPALAVDLTTTPTTFYQKTLKAAATNTFKLFVKRNVDTPTNTLSHNYKVNSNDKKNDMENDVKPKAASTQLTIKTTTALVKDNNNSTTATNITTLRSNVSRVLYQNLKNLNNDIKEGTQKGYDAIYAAPLQDSITKLSRISANELPLAKQTATTILSSAASSSSSFVPAFSTTMTSDVLENSTTYYHNLTLAAYSNSSNISSNNNLTTSNNVILTTMTHLNEMTHTTAAAAAATTTAKTTLAPNITYPSYRLAISSYENCSSLFANYTQPQQQQQGLFCNWTWDKFLCWPPTPAGVLAHMKCPSGFHGVDAKMFANRKCELTGHWGSKPNEPFNPIGWTDYNPCFKPEVKILMGKVSNLELVVEIAKRTRTLEIVGLILSLVALVLSLIIFCNFRSLRNNRTKIHKNLFIAMVLQVVIRLTLYLDQAYRRDSQETANNHSLSGIENTPYLCEASYVLLEYAKTAMFMWMFIEGWYLHNMVTVNVFQGRFPYKLFSIVGWGVPVLMTTIWATCTAVYYAASTHDCWWNYNLTPYYWILEGPRIIVITINFAFLLNIIRVLVMKLRESQASDIEQTRKAVRAAIVLLPLLGTINVLYLIPAYETPWKFALWSYGTHFLTTFQGFFIALLYCFLNGEVRAVLLKSIAVYMSVRGHPEWVPKRASMYSQAYNTAPETENHPPENIRNDSPSSKRLNGRKASCSTVILQASNKNNPKIQINSRQSPGSGQSLNHHQNHNQLSVGIHGNNNNNGAGSVSNIHSNGLPRHRHHHNNHHPNWIMTLCFRGQKNKCVMTKTEKPTSLFMTTKTETLT